MQINNEFMMEWLRARGISEKTVEEAGIYWSDSIVIPVRDASGYFLFNKYRRDPRDETKPKYTYDRGSKVALYNLHTISRANSVLITEGEMDCLVAHSANIPAVTSTGGAMSFQEDWAPNFADKDVTICFDNDDAGAQGMVKALKVLPLAKVVLIPETPGVKDISDYVARGGDLHELLRTARHYASVADVEEDRAARSALWQSVRFHDAYLSANRVQKPTTVEATKYAGDDDRLHAKAFPLTNLIKFTRNKAVCLWHNESTPSLHYYPKTNTAHCFGCGKNVDSIEAYRTIHSCSYKEAIKALT